MSGPDDDEGKDAAPQPLSRSERYKETHALARHGNYHQYYAKFRGQAVPDERLALVPAAILRGARVLDLGCNAGKLTYEVLACCGAAAAVGVDIDPWLVDQARAAYPAGPPSGPSFELLDFAAAAASAANDDGEEEAGAAGYEYGGAAAGTFDVVLLLSVTKWVHLNGGDAGLLAVFARIHAVLNPGGHLVVEPQPMSNYQRAAKKNKDLRETYKQIRVQPPFDAELRAAGFESVLRADRDEEGFARPVHVWRKV